MAYFDYGYFKYSNKGTKKFNPKAEKEQNYQLKEE